MRLRHFYATSFVGLVGWGWDSRSLLLHDQCDLRRPGVNGARAMKWNSVANLKLMQISFFIDGHLILNLIGLHITPVLQKMSA